jgi:hypothetical protein
MFMQPTQISVNTQPAMNAAACDAGMALASATIVGSPSTTASFFARAASATTATTYDFCRVAGVNRDMQRRALRQRAACGAPLSAVRCAAAARSTRDVVLDCELVAKFGEQCKFYFT